MDQVGVVRILAWICAGVVVTAAAARQGEAMEERFVLPSGLEAGLQEVLRQEGGSGPLLRFRFVAPGLEKGAAFEAVSADLEYLCNSVALEQAPEAGEEGATIIISVGNKPSEFGVPDPDVVQVFEAYRVENGTCIWEVF